MNRKDILRFIKTDVCPLLTVKTWDLCDSPMEICKKITDWRRANNYPQTMKATMDNGVLYINGSVVGRIEALVRPTFDEMSYYIEGKILARQEDHND